MAKAEDRQIEAFINQQQPGLLKTLDPTKRNQVVELLGKVGIRNQLQLTQTEIRQHSGPLPPADELQRYGQVVRDGAERIMTMAEAQQQHRMQLEKTVVSSQQAQSAAGQWMGFCLVVLMVIAGTWLGLSGKEVAAATVFGTTILGVAGVFVIGRRSQAKDLESKK